MAGGPQGPSHHIVTTFRPFRSVSTHQNVRAWPIRTGLLTRRLKTLRGRRARRLSLQAATESPSRMFIPPCSPKPSDGFGKRGPCFQRPPGEVTPTSLIIGLSFAAHAELRERGDDASIKLQVAASLFATIAELRMALEDQSPETEDGMHEKLAELTIRSAMLGQVDMLMTAIELGWFDKLAEFEMERETRRRGAAATNAKKVDVRQRALNEAVRIAGQEPDAQQ